MSDEALLSEAASLLDRVPEGPWRCYGLASDLFRVEVCTGEAPAQRSEYGPAARFLSNSRLYVEALVRMVEVRDRIMADWAGDNAAVLEQGRRQGLALAALKARGWVSRAWPDRAASMAMHNLADAIETQAGAPPLPADALRLENARLREALRMIAEYEPREAWAALQTIAREALGETGDA